MEPDQQLRVPQQKLAEVHRRAVDSEEYEDVPTVLRIDADRQLVREVADGLLVALAEDEARVVFFAQLAS